MAIAFDAGSEATPACASSLTWSHTTGSLSDGIICVGITWRGTATVSTVTYNADSCTAITSFAASNTNQKTNGYYRVGPDSGTHDVVVTMSTSAFDLGAGAATFSGVDQSTPFGTADTNTGTGTSATVAVASDAGEWTVGVVSYTDATSGGNVTPSGTEIWTNWTDCQNGTESNGQYVTTEDPTLTWSGLNTEWACSGVPLQVGTPASAALTGTATASIDEADIVAGGKTLIVTLTGDTFVSDTVVTPVIEAADVTESGNNTAEDPWAVSYPNASTGDLLIFCIGWDDSTTVTTVTAPSGPNGETLTTVEGPTASSGTAVRGQVWYTVATGTWTASTLSFNPSGLEQWTAMVIRVPAGEFDGSTPIGAFGEAASAAATETEVDSPAFSAGSTDGGGRILFFAIVNADPLSATPPTDYSLVLRRDRGAVAIGIVSRDAAAANSESIGSAAWDLDSTNADAWASISFIVRAPTSTPFSAARQAFIDGFDAASSPANGWNNEVRDKAAVTEVVRTSSTVATWTIAAQAGYDISSQETITGTIPASILTLGAQIVASPTFTIDPSGADNFNATGDLDSQSATISGAGLHGRTSTGALAAQAATVSGAGLHGRVAAGDLDAQSATISGAATVSRTATGSLTVQSATMAGAGVVGRTATGALASASATIDGEGTVQTASFNATGDLQAGTVEINGTGIVNRTATGALAAQSVTISGQATTSAAPTVVVQEDQGSNWQAYRHKKRLTDEELAELIREQRIALGILPPDLPGQAVAEPADIAEEVTAAVQNLVTMGEIKIDRRRIYRAAYLEAEYAIAEYRDLTRRHKRRKRAAMLMLLH